MELRVADSVSKWAAESFGEAGELWVGNAVAELLEFAAERGVTGLSVLSGGRRSLVVSGVLDDARVVIKSSPDPDDMCAREALMHWARSGLAPQVLESRGPHSMFEFVDGVDLAGCDDLMAVTAELASLIAGTHAEAVNVTNQRAGLLASKFQVARRRASSIDHPVLSVSCVDRAEQIAAELSSGVQLGLLHGDLTPVNVMRSSTGALKVIDPEPFVGPLGFDLAIWCLRAGLQGEVFDLVAVAADAADVDALELLEWTRTIAVTWGVGKAARPWRDQSVVGVPETVLNLAAGIS